MFKIVEWTPDLDLTAFYAEAEKKGFLNNSSQKVMIDAFRNEKSFKAWILYKDTLPIGSVVSHTFDDVMGKNSFRVLARTCVLMGARYGGGLMTAKTAIGQHQNLTDQFLLTSCINWTGVSNIYATSNESLIASQRFVHKTYFPTLEKLGLVERVKEVYYRGTDQTIWKINGQKFLDHLNLFPRWT